MREVLYSLGWLGHDLRDPSKYETSLRLLTRLAHPSRLPICQLLPCRYLCTVAENFLRLRNEPGSESARRETFPELGEIKQKNYRPLPLNRLLCPLLSAAF